MARPKKNKNTKSLNNLEQLHGKLENSENIGYDPQSPHTLDQIMGEREFAKYTTSNLDEYTEQLNEMNGTDLNRHAKKVGLIPSHDNNKLKSILIAEFVKYNRKGPKISIQDFYNPAKPQNVSKEALKVLREGA